MWKGGGTYEKFRSKDSLKSRDVIIVGSSRAYRHYNPVYFGDRGLSVWNLGSSAQPIENSYSIIKDVIVKAKPKYILLDVARLGFEQSSIESSIDLITNTSSVELIRNIVIGENDIRLFNTTLVSYFNKDLPSLYEDKEYKGAGFSTKSDSLSKGMMQQLENLTDAKKNGIIIHDFEVLDSIISYCKQHEQKLILVHSPVSEFYSKQAQNSFMDKVRDLGIRYSIPLYDFQYLSEINTINHFYDDSHLNSEGVKIFNQKLLKRVSFE